MNLFFSFVTDTFQYSILKKVLNKKIIPYSMSSPPPSNSEIYRIDPTQFDIDVLDEVFSCFITSLESFPERFNVEDFTNVSLNRKQHGKVIFTHENKEWYGKLIRSKWNNNTDNGNIWSKLSLKLPNDGIIRKTSHQNSSMYPIDSTSVDREPQTITFALNFFDDENVNMKLLYIKELDRLIIRVTSEKHKACLDIVFEYGIPNEFKTDGWYSKEKLKELLGNFLQ